MLAYAIAGNPNLQDNGVRSDFGYVGDIGALPPDLDALYANPGGYATWKGPYVGNRFSQTPGDFKTDAWGNLYVYSGTGITSTGSGSDITRRVAPTADELLFNRTSGTITDRDGTPPGSVWRDSVRVTLTYPNGSGSTVSRTVFPDAGGFFSFDSLPIGNHRLGIDYRPTGDTLYRLVSVTPRSRGYADYRLNSNVWHDASGGGGLVMVPGSDSLVADCHGFSFWILNPSGGAVDISSLTVTYTGLAGYYRYVRWDGVVVVNANNPSLGSGDLAAFSTVRTIADGASVRIDIDFFKSTPTGGGNVDVDNTTFTVTLSDGSTFTAATGGCP